MQKTNQTQEHSKCSERNVISKKLDEDQPLKKRVLIGTAIVGLGISIFLTHQVLGAPTEEVIDNPVETTSISDAILERESQLVEITAEDLATQEVVKDKIETIEEEKNEFQVDEDLKKSIQNTTQLGTTIALNPIEEEEIVEEKEETIEVSTNSDNQTSDVETTSEPEIEVESEPEVEPEPVTYTYSGSILTAYAGVNYGPTGKETYYNLDMSGVVSIMRGMGFDEENYPYWVREDGCKMLGPYIMVAANLDMFPRGSTVECSLGTALVCDTGGFAASNPTQLDIATTW